MLASTQWLSRYLSPSALTAEQAEHALTSAGFPIESATPVTIGGKADTRLDVEVTSNRGDCLSHVGLAREIAAQSRGRVAFAPPAFTPRAHDPQRTDAVLRVENTVPKECPRFTARVIRGVTVGPGPAWMRDALESVGQRPINNVVDATNFVNFELGQPCHVFDLAKLAGPALVIRFAREKEEITTLDEKRRVLRADDVVLADAQRAQGIAGVMGGLESAVTGSTRDLVLEVATWDPVAVRRAARRHALRTDASFRYERLVDARAVDAAAERVAWLITEVAGGRVCDAPIAAGPALPALAAVHLRPARCRAILGYDLPTAEIVRLLALHEIHTSPVGRAGEDLLCTIPTHRPDLTREIDLIEEVARTNGLDAVPLQDKLRVVVPAPQTRERARRELSTLLTGMGFYETVTFSFTGPTEAQALLPPGLEAVRVDDERRGEEPILRPSVLTGLLACRRANLHAQVHVEGGLRLFEPAAVFAQRPGSPPRSVESQNLGLLMDVVVKGKSASAGELQCGVRAMRGVVESLVRAAAGSRVRLVFEPGNAGIPALDPAASARISLDATPLGYLGLISTPVQATYDLPHPVMGAELNWDALLSAYPPRGSVTPLPQFPPIERDISLIVDERVSWARVEEHLAGARVEHMEGWTFVGTYRGPQIGAGRKSVTVRLRFRDPTRTLRHDEVDAPVARVVDAMKHAIGAELRT